MSQKERNAVNFVWEEAGDNIQGKRGAEQDVIVGLIMGFMLLFGFGWLLKIQYFHFGLSMFLVPEFWLKIGIRPCLKFRYILVP